MELQSTHMPWVSRISGATRRGLAESVTTQAALIPDDAIIIDGSGKQIGSWFYRHNFLPDGRSGLVYWDNVPGAEYAWIADRGDAICVQGSRPAGQPPTGE